MNTDLSQVEAIHYPEGSIIQPKGSDRSIFKISNGTPCVNPDIAERIVEGSAYQAAWNLLRDELDRRIQTDLAMGFGVQDMKLSIFECRRLMEKIESGEFKN